MRGLSLSRRDGSEEGGEMLTSVIATQSKRLLRLIVVADFAREPSNALQSRLRAALVNACSCESSFGVLHVGLDELLLLPRKVAQQDGGRFGLQEGVQSKVAII